MTATSSAFSPIPHYDAIVIGLGAIGAATLYQLAKRGARVLGMDRFNPPHDQGSSHGESRITRLAIGEGDEYVPLVQRSHDIWRELEALTGRNIMTTTGGLVLAPRDRLAAHHGKADFVRRTIDCATRHGIAHEVLDAAEVRQRYPQFKLQGNELAYAERDSGFVRPEEAIAAQLQAARAFGAEIHTSETALGLQPLGNGERVQVDTALGSYSASQIVIAAGAWLPGFLGQSLQSTWHKDFQVYRQTMYWFDAKPVAADFSPGRFPIFIWMFGDEQEDYMYGFPGTDASQPTLKVATEQYETTTTPAELQREVRPEEVEAMYRSRVAGRFPQISGAIVKASACMYTVTPDRNFVIDTLDGAPNITVASACSGHGFKHSAGIGQALAEKVLGLASQFDLSAFGRSRLQV